MSEEYTLEESLEKFKFSKGQGLALLLCSYIPFLHIAITLCALFVPWTVLAWRIVTALALLYILPPILARCILRIWPIKTTVITIPSRDYFTWWILLNLQVVFCRLTFLEELIRLIPGAYGPWLRLWGARIGKYIYWAAGLRILDRSFLDIGTGVTFGAGVRLNPHVVAENEDGKPELLLATIHIGSRASIGGYALLTTGNKIADDESTRACLLSPPFSHWKDGKRIKKGVMHNES